MKQFSPDSYIDLLYQEFLFEHNRADTYIERNYQVLGLWAAALAGLYAIGMNEDFITTDMSVFLIFAEMIPVLNFVFAIIYFFNSYANLRCGDRAAAIHKAIFTRANMLTYSQIEMDGENTKKFFIDNLPEYVLTETISSLPMYVTLLLVIVVSSSFGYYYAYSTCEGVDFKNGVFISATVVGILTVVVAALYITLMIKNAKPREEIKKNK